jgi:hypothetical protein
MEHKEHRRKHKRYPVRWEAAVVFDRASGKPTLRTQTQDLSPGGAAILTGYEDLTGTMFTLLLAQPAREGHTPNMIKVRARVVSTVQLPAGKDFRHGLSFVRSEQDGLDALEEILKAAAPAAAARPAASAPADSLGSTGRLAMLRQMAQAKLAEAPKGETGAGVDVRARIEEALQRAHKFYKEFAEQLNIVKPAFPGKGYAIGGMPEFSGLAWDHGYAELRAREIGPTRKQLEIVALYYKLSGGKQLRIVRDYPASEKVARALGEVKLEFKSTEKRNAKGSLEQVTFALPCEVAASLLLTANYETGKLQVKARNVGHFGFAEWELAPEAVTEAALDESTGFILGETGRIGGLGMRGG